MKMHVPGCLIVTLVLAGCVSSSNPARNSAVAEGKAAANPVLEKQFVLDVLQHLYRWHFDQSYALEANKADTLEVWARPLQPVLDTGDRSEFAELWIPAVNMRVELKRSDYTVPEMAIAVVDHAFKVKRVTRQLQPPASSSHYQVARYALPEVQDYLFATRTNRVAVSASLRMAARKLAAEYLQRAHPAPFTEDQILYLAPISPVCNDVWVLWESGRKILLFSADVNLANPGFAALSQLRMQVIDLEKEVVASTKEVPGSNAFVTKDWVGRLFFNCIVFGERWVRTAEEMNQLRAPPATPPPPHGIEPIAPDHPRADVPVPRE